MAGKAQGNAALAIPPEHIGNVKVTRPQTGAGISGLAARRPHRLHLRRAGQGRHHPSGLPQHRAHGRPPLRRAARRQAQAQAPAADRHRQWRHDARLLQGAEDHGRSPRRARCDRRMGAGSPMAGWAARRTTRPRSSRRSARTPISTIRTRTTPSAGTSSARSACRSSITRSSIRRSIATVRRTKSPTSAAMSRRRPTPASSCPAPRWSRPDRC